MASIYPSDIPTERPDGFANDEFETLVALRDGLSDDYSVYHSVHWSNPRRKYTIFGEIDFVIVNPAGHVVVIEQKNGPLFESQQGLEKHYGLDKKLVFSQVQRNYDNLRDKFKDLNPSSPKLTVDYVIYCPDYRVLDVNAAGVDMRRTVDSQSRSSLAERVTQLFKEEADENPHLREDLQNFLLNSFRIAPDVNAYKTNQRRVFHRLLDGLTEVIENLEFSPFRLRIIGTAGSGKTQVTMRFCERALEEGRKPLLVCYNRRLADKLIDMAPDGVVVNTYHGFCHAMAKRAGVLIDFKKANEKGFWRGIQDQLLAATHSTLPRFDCLVVDEGQDFEDEWYEMLKFFVDDEATELWLEDPLQNLRQSDPVPLPGFVTYHETGNFRTPQSIAEFIKGVLDSDFIQRNSLPGLGVDLQEYETEVELSRLLDTRVHTLVKSGFDPADIAIVSCRGLDSSALADIQQVSKYKIRRYTGKYNARNQQIYTDGVIDFDSVRRFKGDQAAAVILVDLDADFARNDENQGMLYCAMTRATMRLELLVRNDCPWIDIFREHAA